MNVCPTFALMIVVSTMMSVLEMTSLLYCSHELSKSPNPTVWRRLKSSLTYAFGYSWLSQDLCLVRRKPGLSICKECALCHTLRVSAGQSALIAGGADIQRQGLVPTGEDRRWLGCGVGTGQELLALLKVRHTNRLYFIYFKKF